MRGFWLAVWTWRQRRWRSYTAVWYYQFIAAPFFFDFLSFCCCCCPPDIFDCSWLLFVCWFAFVFLCPFDQAKSSECCLLRSKVHTCRVITGSPSLGKKKRWTLCLCLYFCVYSRYANAVRLFFTICSIKTHQRCRTISHRKRRWPSVHDTAFAYNPIQTCIIQLFFIKVPS